MILPDERRSSRELLALLVLLTIAALFAATHERPAAGVQDGDGKAVGTPLSLEP